MKTTEVLFEHVLAGTLLLLTVGLPFLPVIPKDIFFKGTDGPLANLTTLESILSSAALLAVAYVVGVIFDRYADSVLEPLERHNRLRFALGRKQAARQWFAHTSHWQDPFPEGNLRTRILAHGGALADWMNHLRTRMRIARTLAIYLPGLGLSMAVALGGVLDRGLASSFVAGLVLGVILLAYAVYLPGLLALLKSLDGWNNTYLAGKEKAKISIREPFDRLVGTWRPPKTHQAERLRRYADVRGYTGDANAPPPAIAYDIVLSPAVLAGASLTVAAFLITHALGQPYLWIVPLAASALAVFSGWAWWRMTGTFMTYVADAEAVLRT